MADTFFQSVAGSAAPVTQSISNTASISVNTDLALLDFSSNSAYNATLPAASQAKLLRVKASTITMGNNAILLRAGADLIRSAGSNVTAVILYTQDEEYDLISDGVTTWNVVGHKTSTDWVGTLTWTPNNFGTIGAQDVRWRRIGDSVEVVAYFTAGTVAAGIASLTLPVALPIDSTKLSSSSGLYPLGLGYSAQTASTLINTNASTATVFYDGSDTAKVYLTAKSASAVLAKENANDAWNSSTGFMFHFTYPVSGWKA